MSSVKSKRYREAMPGREMPQQETLLLIRVVKAKLRGKPRDS